MAKFFLKFKKPYFWTMFGKVFPKNLAVMDNFIKVSSAMPKFREI